MFVFFFSSCWVFLSYISILLCIKLFFSPSWITYNNYLFIISFEFPLQIYNSEEKKLQCYFLCRYSFFSNFYNNQFVKYIIQLFINYYSFVATIHVFRFRLNRMLFFFKCCWMWFLQRTTKTFHFYFPLTMEIYHSHIICFKIICNYIIIYIIQFFVYLIFSHLFHNFMSVIWYDHVP